MATVETFTSSTTWTAPTGVFSVDVECWGAGGGAAGSNSSLLVQGGGGGGGAYSKKTITVTPGNNYTIVVGTGGAGGTASGSPTNGSAGGDTYFINTSTVMAKGGDGANGATRGLGGASASGVGITKFSGGNGSSGSGISSGGAGGGGAGSAANGGAASGTTGGSAGSPDGGAGASTGGSPSAPGGGGQNPTWISSGGDGARGYMKLTYIPIITSTISHTTDAYLQAVIGIPTWSSPANHATGIVYTTPLVFTIPPAIMDMHFQIDIADDSGFTTNLVSIKSWIDQTGWEYYNGTTWVAFPAGGVSNTYSGNLARYTPQVPLAESIHYRRVRGRGRITA